MIAAVADALGGYLYPADRQTTLVTAVGTALARDESLAGALLAGARLKEPVDLFARSG